VPYVAVVKSARVAEDLTTATYGTTFSNDGRRRLNE
jgi:hypothetical protein